MIKLKPRTRIILLSVISILIVVTIVLGITYSFMQANIESSSVTEVSLSSCANITLTDTGESINLSNSYPMSKTRALETTPYTLTITSSCEDGSGYNLYLATLNTNTLSASSIHYIITEHGNQNIVVEGMLSDASDGISDFEDYELNELNNGINGTYGSIYRLHSSGINYNTEVTYDLYLYIDESVTNETMGQTFSAGLAVKASDYDFASVDEVTVTETTNDSITVSVSATAGTNTIQNYYYSINNGEYVSSTSNTYTFERLEMGTEYNIKVYVTDTNGVQSNVYNLSVQTDDTPPTLADTCRETGSNTLACHVATQYTTDGENGLYYHDADLANGARDNSYRYAGASEEVNNYVCFGSTASTCPSDNLYRIIGVFGNQVKLIKADYTTTLMTGSDGSYYGAYGSSSTYKGQLNPATNLAAYYWNNNTSTNTWSESNLNAVNLNTNYINYLNNIDSKWAEKIATTEWKVGGNTGANIYGQNAPTAYQNEIVNPVEATTYSAKIGLMYVSDYGYAASPDAWATDLVDYDNSTIIASNWMYMGIDEWTISRNSGYTNNAFEVFYAGSVLSNDVNYYNGIYGVRPSFYLNSSVNYVSGSGTADDPFRIS